MKLEPGYYKVQRDDKSAFKKKAYRGNPNSIRMLKVEGKGKDQKYYIDGDTVGYMKPEDLQEYEILGKYEREPIITPGRLTITFKDAAGNEFCFSVNDAWALRNVFEKWDFLKKPFYFVKRRNLKT